VCVEHCGRPGYAIACRWCTRQFVVCVRDYRGQAYCCEKCRREARRLQRQQAQATYLGKLLGKRRRAKAAKDYRARKAKGLVSAGGAAKIVIDQALRRLGFGRQDAVLREGRCVICECRCRVIALRR
jgi:hypothetical protein